MACGVRAGMPTHFCRERHTWRHTGLSCHRAPVHCLGSNKVSALKECREATPTTTPKSDHRRHPTPSPTCNSTSTTTGPPYAYSNRQLPTATSNWRLLLPHRPLGGGNNMPHGKWTVNPTLVPARSEFYGPGRSLIPALRTGCHGVPRSQCERDTGHRVLCRLWGDYQAKWGSRKNRWPNNRQPDCMGKDPSVSQSDRTLLFLWCIHRLVNDQSDPLDTNGIPIFKAGYHLETDGP